MPVVSVLEKLFSYLSFTQLSRWHPAIYMGLPKIIEYLNNRLGLGFDLKDSSFQAACELIEVRNILVHNAGRVNKVFLQRTGRTDLHEGGLCPLTLDYLVIEFQELTNVAGELDGMITSHFKLNQG